MRLIRLIILSCCFLISKARFVEKIPEDAKSPRVPNLLSYVHAQHAPKIIRRGPTKNIDDNNKIAPIFVYNPKLRPSASAKRRILVRDPRHSGPKEVENWMTYSVNKEKDETKQVLIKAPIPKFYELDYENEFQTHQENLSVRHAVDSGPDPEDEDFNVSDYDFDVNHDEFLGQGKPIEPKVKILENLFMSDLARSEEENLHKISKPVEVKEVKPKVKEHPAATYKPGLQTESDDEDETKAPPVKTDDEVKYGDTGDHYDRVIHNRKFTVFGGSPKYSLLLVPWW